MRRALKLFLLVPLFPFVFLSGCAAVALTLFGVGAGVSTGTAVSYSLNGYAYRTFTASLPQVRAATMTAFDRMGIKVKNKEKTEQGELIQAVGFDRQIEVGLESISAKSTRMRTVAKQGFFLKDRATATEIILQTEGILGET